MKKLTNKKALFIDYDRTLWFGKYGEKTLDALKRAHDEGILLFLSTGRAKGFTPFKNLEVIDFDGFLCGGNHVIIDGKDAFRRDMTKEEIALVKEVTRKFGLYTSAEGAYSVYAFSPLPDWVTRTVEYVSEDETFEDKPLSKLTIFKEKDGDKFLPINKEAEKMLATYFDVIDFGYYTECLIKGLGKSALVNFTKDYFGLKDENTYAFGDSLNDLPMFKSTGHGAAIGHAPEELKLAADYVTVSEEDGIAEALGFYGLI